MTSYWIDYLKLNWRAYLVAMIMFLVAWQGYSVFNEYNHIESIIQSRSSQYANGLEVSLKQGDLTASRKYVEQIAGKEINYLTLTPVRGLNGLLQKIETASGAPPESTTIFVKNFELKSNGALIGVIDYRVNILSLAKTVFIKNKSLFIFVVAFFLFLLFLANFRTLRANSLLKESHKRIMNHVGVSTIDELSDKIEAELLQLKKEGIPTDSLQATGISFEMTKILTRRTEQLLHDLKSPLSSLSITASLLKDAPENQKRLLSDGIEDLSSILKKFNIQIKNSKSVVSPGAGQNDQQIALHNLNRLLESVVSQKQEEYGKFTNLCLELEESPYRGVYGLVDATEFKTIISNLVNNSVDAIGSDKGLVSLRLEIEDGGFAKVRVIDTGCGVTEAIRSQIFERTVSAKGSTGLGLYHAKKTVESWHGEIRHIETDSTEKTEFQILIPLVRVHQRLLDSQRSLTL